MAVAVFDIPMQCSERDSACVHEEDHEPERYKDPQCAVGMQQDQCRDREKWREPELRDEPGKHLKILVRPGDAR